MAEISWAHYTTNTCRLLLCHRIERERRNKTNTSSKKWKQQTEKMRKYSKAIRRFWFRLLNTFMDEIIIQVVVVHKTESNTNFSFSWTIYMFNDVALFHFHNALILANDLPNRKKNEWKEKEKKSNNAKEWKEW